MAIADLHWLCVRKIAAPGPQAATYHRYLPARPSLLVVASADASDQADVAADASDTVDVAVEPAWRGHAGP